MKRSAAAHADGDIPPIKRHKLDASDAAVNVDDPSTAGNDARDPFRPTLQRKATDVCQTGVDQTGFIKGNVIMRWPIRNDTNRIVVEAVEDGRTVKFEVEFSGLSLKFLDGKGVTIAVGGQLYLSLRGATLKDKQSSQGNYLPKIFQYCEGAALKYIGKGTPREEVQLDYWANHPPQLQQEQHRRNTGDAPFGDDWFATPAGPAPVTEKPVPEKSHSQIAEPTPVDSEPHPIASPDRVANPTPKPLEESPVENPPEAKSVLPPKRLYRNVGGRPTPGNLRNTPALSSTHIDTTNETRPAPASLTTGNAVAGPSTIPVEGLPNRAQKKAQKKAAREAKRAARGQGNDIPPIPKTGDTPKLPQFQTAKSVHLAAIASASASGSTTPGPPSPAKPVQPTTTPVKAVPPNRSIPPSPARTRLTSSQQAPAPDLDLVAGCHSLQGVVFRPLNDLNPGFEPVSIIAVLAVVNPVNTTTTQEQCRRVIVVDPSNVNRDNPSDGFSINLFAKKASELPDGKPGDVLLLHGLQVANYQGRKSGVCPSYKAWSWAVFAPETGNTTQSPVSSAAGSFGLSNELGPPELKYCIALGDWWRAVSKEHQRKLQESGITVHQLQDVQQRSASRVHRLIKDAAPDAPPNGYFNTTVEVLYGHENANGVYSLYVTDYTKNENLYPIQANWCTPAYEGYAFKIDMWNEAAVEAPKLQPHDYYEINNVRMKLSTGGYWEGSFSEMRKMRKLDEDELEGEPKLAALLERKKKWEEEVEQHGGHKFPHKLFQEAELDKHFCATVEILRISTKDNDRVLLFVTDYTARQDLAPIAATADWTQDIDPDRIVKIALFNLQVKTAADLRAGDIVAIRNLRLKALSGGVNVAGQVGGNDRLIYKLDPKTTGNEDCIALLGRKKAWEKRLQERQAARERNSNAKKAAKGKTKANGFVPKSKAQAAKASETDAVHNEAPTAADVKVPDVPQSPPEEPTKHLPGRPAGTVTLKSIMDVETSTIAKYRVVARVSDFYPMRVEDFVVLHCTNCGKDIPEQYRICTTCDEDMMDTHVRPFFRFHFELEDEEGTRLQVLVAHNEWPHVPDILQDLEPVDFNEDPDALEEFRAKLRPVLGELLDKHEELVEDSEEGSPAADTPLCNIVVGATPAIDSEERRFCLWSCAPLG